MNLLNEIRRMILQRDYEFSKHAVDQSIIREIEVYEVEQAIGGDCEVIENYPNDKYGPSCLVLGFTETRRPLHIHCGYSTGRRLKIITLYEPSVQLWDDNRVRRKK